MALAALLGAHTQGTHGLSVIVNSVGNLFSGVGAHVQHWYFHISLQVLGTPLCGRTQSENSTQITPAILDICEQLISMMAATESEVPNLKTATEKYPCSLHATLVHLVAS